MDLEYESLSLSKPLRGRRQRLYHVEAHQRQMENKEISDLVTLLDDPMVREIANNKGSGRTARMRRLVSQAIKSGFLALFMRAANVLASLCDCVACLSDRVLSQF